jgi:N-acetylneuraminic acid mutarotase
MASWTRRASLPVAISEVGVTALAGRLHVVGGTDEEGKATTLHLAYDPVADTWEEQAPLPTPMHHVAVVGTAGRLYAIGGLSENVHLGPHDSAFAYDPFEDRWSGRPSLPKARGSIGVAAVEGKVHAFGGRSAESVVHVSAHEAPEMLIGVGTVTNHDIYDPDAGSWTVGPALPGPPRDHMGIATLAGKIHVFGGRQNDYTDMLDRHDVYDPSSASWAAAAPLPRPRSAGAFVVIDGRIVYAGGECKPGGAPFSANTFDDAAAYGAETDAWVDLTPLPEGRHAFGGATISGVAYFAGGALVCGGGASADLLALSLEGD